ncbi:CvfB family protein [Alkaliphilus serpentinus]|uniref:S1 RNA-binding domain-containing protein n=1 Tax=Alkaliphilus serpentinus TaxID=1482731 RepID=A0A833M7G4_9FIRM|nr:S1-like domain-containing RNA-binding protein [Alkaliphilus serpentinus]KAB3530439.1 S1 RNA-binding domain-containing protein [Alkaliphilus serpentinus]
MKVEIGKKNQLIVTKILKNAVFLSNGRDEDHIILPIGELSEDISEGDSIEVFIYRDSEDKLAATTKEPLAKVGELAYLKVVDVTKIGAFLYWGLEKDLFVPIREQTCKMEKHKYYLVKIYLDKSKRLCGSMKLEDALRTDSPFKAGDTVQGTVYGLSRDLGVFVAVENKYHGLLHNSEVTKDYRIGDKEVFRIVKVRDDGKLDLSTKKLAHHQMEEDANDIVKYMIRNKGYLPLRDNSSPEEIKKYFKISKNAFKRAIGKLLKERIVEIDSDGIRFTKDKPVE